MTKEYTTKNISKNDFEDIVRLAIEYYTKVETNYTFKFKFTNFKKQSINILALDDIQHVYFDDNFKTAYIKYNDECININLEKYSSFVIELTNLFNDLNTTLVMDLRDR